jgi:hypothetical protein
MHVTRDCAEPSPRAQDEGADVPTVTVQPSATYQGDNGPWASVGGSTPTILKDSSDSTYVGVTTSYQGNTYVWYDLPNPTIPATGMIKSVTPRLRARDDCSGLPYYPSDVRTSFYGAGHASVAWQNAQNFQAYSSTTPAFYNAIATASLASFSAPNAAAADISSIAFNAVDQSNGGLPHITWKVYEVFVDTLYAAQPTCTATAPSGTVGNTSTPTVTWGYTAGTDGGVQKKYEVAVFNTTQYGIGGFDPAVSPATWRSGQVTSTGTSVVVGTPLPNANTYRAYVRVAQDVGGVDHWSTQGGTAWSYSQFTMSIAPPNVPSLTATADSANGRVTLHVTDSSPASALTEFEIDRSEDGGTSWQIVRGDLVGGYVAPVSGGTSRTIYDYEGSPATSIIYRARAAWLNTGQYIWSAFSSSTAPVTWTTTLLWIKNPIRTSLCAQFRIVEFVATERDGRSKVFAPVGRRNPIVVKDARGGQVGTLTLHTGSAADRVKLDALLDAQQTLLLQCPAGWEFGDLYVSIDKSQRTRNVRVLVAAQRQEQLGVIEVDAPTMNYPATDYGQVS